MGQLTTIATRPDEASAELTAGFLRRQGIQCRVVADADSISLYGSGAYARYRLIVPPEDALRARALLGPEGGEPGSTGRGQSKLIVGLAAASLLVALVGAFCGQR